MIPLILSIGNMVYFKKHKQFENTRTENIYQVNNLKRGRMVLLGYLDFKTEKPRDYDKTIAVMINNIVVIS